MENFLSQSKSRKKKSEWIWIWVVDLRIHADSYDVDLDIISPVNCYQFTFCALCQSTHIAYRISHTDRNSSYFVYFYLDEQLIGICKADMRWISKRWIQYFMNFSIKSLWIISKFCIDRANACIQMYTRYANDAKNDSPTWNELGIRDVWFYIVCECECECYLHLNI